MSEKTKRIMIRRSIREVITVKRAARIVLICENCGNEQNFTPVENAAAEITGEKSGESESVEFFSLPQNRLI